MKEKIYNIRVIMSNIKKQNQNNKKVITNYYGQCNKFSELEFDMVKNENAIAFLYYDVCVWRIYFYASNKESLIEILKKMPKDSIIDYITKNEEEYRELFELSGFYQHSVFHKLITDLYSEKVKKIGEKLRVLHNLFDENIGRVATLADIEVIYNTMKEEFDVANSHFCSIEKLKELVEHGWVMIHKEENELIAFMIYTIEGIKRYGYYMYNKGDVSVNYILGNKVSALDKERGIKFVYGWVDRDNKKAIRFNTFWGAEFDGIFDEIYVKGV